MIRASAPGRCGLIGNPTDGYGGTVISSALGERAEVEMTPAGEILLDICNQYTIQGDLFSQAVLNDTEVPTPIEDAVANMKAIEAVFRSAQSGTWG